VSLELPLNQHLKNFLLRRVLVALWLVVSAVPLPAETPKADIPDPIKFINTFDVVGNVVYPVLDDMGFDIELDGRKSGKIITRPLEFITGSLTSSEIEKYAVKNDLPEGNWLKARYSAEAIMEIVKPAETMVTIRVKIEALNRTIEGKEKWMQLESLGTFEKRILGKISLKLMGNDAPLFQRKGFWGQKPQPVDPRKPNI
jgi:hypothetical protein